MGPTLGSAWLAVEAGKADDRRVEAFVARQAGMATRATTVTQDVIAGQAILNGTKMARLAAVRPEIAGECLMQVTAENRWPVRLAVAGEYNVITVLLEPDNSPPCCSGRMTRRVEAKGTPRNKR